MFVVFTGQVGSGKTTSLIQTFVDNLWRNEKWYNKLHKQWEEKPEMFDKEPKMRQSWLNHTVAKKIEEEYNSRYLDNKIINYWHDLRQLTTLHDVDIYWDEIPAMLDSTQWANTGIEVKRFLQQHRKRGIEIYGTAQDFAQVDIAARRIVTDLIYWKKIIGSPDPSPTKPKPKRIWGFSLGFDMDPTTYNEKSKITIGLPRFQSINSELISYFDTREDIPVGKFPPLKHVERDCEDSNCTYHKILHV